MRWRLHSPSPVARTYCTYVCLAGSLITSFPGRHPHSRLHLRGQPTDARIVAFTYRKVHSAEMPEFVKGILLGRFKLQLQGMLGALEPSYSL